MQVVIAYLYCLQQAEPPDDVHVSDINPNHFTIKWSPPASDCPIVAYNIASSNCGVCPNITTTNMSITCTNLMVEGQVCSIVVQAMVCENSSEHSGAANLTMVLKGNYV